MKYEVELKQEEIYVFEDIEADSEEDAENKALELYEKDKETYHYDSDTEIEVFEKRE